MFSEPPRLSVSACGGQACAKTLHFCTSKPCKSAVKPAHSKAALLPDALSRSGQFRSPDGELSANPPGSHPGRIMDVKPGGEAGIDASLPDALSRSGQFRSPDGELNANPPGSHPEICLEKKLAERPGFEPGVPVARYNRLAICRFQPLSHLSAEAECPGKIYAGAHACKFLFTPAAVPAQTYRDGPRIKP